MADLETRIVACNAGSMRSERLFEGLLDRARSSEEEAARHVRGRLFEAKRVVSS